MDQASVKRLREEWGFVITDDRDPDLLGWLFNAYLDHVQGAVDLVPADSPLQDPLASNFAAIKHFIEFAREKLRENPPMTMTYLPRGIAVQLQNYQQLVLVEPKEDAPDTGDTRAKGVVGVTTANRGGGGVPGFRQTDSAVPVTGAGPRKK